MIELWALQCCKATDAHTCTCTYTSELPHLLSGRPAAANLGRLLVERQVLPPMLQGSLQGLLPAVQGLNLLVGGQQTLAQLHHHRSRGPYIGVDPFIALLMGQYSV